MDAYITGSAIRTLRERRRLTQAQLAERISVSDKAVSKWETGRGLPDVSLLEPLSTALGVSLPELLSGEQVRNVNRSANLLRARFYVCPLCGNILHAAGDALISCCGLPLPPLEAEEPDPSHTVSLQPVEDEFYLTFRHPMSKDHFLSFAAWRTGDRLELVKLYPEGGAETRLRCRGQGVLLWYCNRHGLFQQALPRHTGGAKTADSLSKNPLGFPTG